MAGTATDAATLEQVSKSTIAELLPGEGHQVVIQPSRGWIAINWRDIWRYRELLYFLTWRDLKIRYRQTVLGFLWAFIQPFLKMVVFSMVFGKLAKMDSEGFPYPIFLYAGLLPWQFFSDSLSRSSESVVLSAHLITKVYFPRLVIPLASTGAALVDFGVSFTILIGLMVYYRVLPTAATLAVLPLVPLTVLTALGVGIFLSPLNVAYRDFRHTVPFLVQIWMFLTPVIYPVRIVPQRWQWLVALNPMAGIVDAYRSAILGKPFAWGNLTISTAVAVVVFFFSAVYFRRLERQFADIV